MKEIAEKTKFCVDNGLMVMWCCGEHKEEREAGTDGKGGEEDEDRAEGPQTKDSTSAAAAPPLLLSVAWHWAG